MTGITQNKGGPPPSGPPPSPKAILFDWDNTLVDNWPAIHDALNTTFVAMGHETWTLEESRGRLRKSLRDSFPEMFGDRWTDAQKIFYDRFEETHLTNLIPLPGAGDLLGWLAASDIYLAVVSNKAGGYLRQEAAELGWDGYFSRIVGATDATEDKPARAPVDMALEGSGIAPERDVWFVGDAAIDVKCALNSGLTPVLLMQPDTEKELSRHNLVPFVMPECRLLDMGGLKKLVQGDFAPISRQ